MGAFSSVNLFYQILVFSSYSVSASEAICETWESIINKMNKQRLRSEDGNEEFEGTNDK